MDYRELDKYVKYSAKSPTGLVWKLSGESAGSLDKSKGYYITQIRGKRYKTHRIVYCLVNKCTLDPKELIDHEDGNRLNNKRKNLRKVSIEINNRNLCVRKDSKTGVGGVFSRDNYYVAAYYDQGKRKTKFFDRAKLGTKVALKKAKEWRKLKLQELNIGYTERHGT